MDVPDPAAGALRLLEAREELVALANDQDSMLVGLRGGARELTVRDLPT